MIRPVSLALLTGTALTGLQIPAIAASSWKGDAELGILNTSGNTNTRSITAKGNAVNEGEHWRHTLKAEALNSAEKGVTTSERYFAFDKSDYKLSENSYVFGQLSYDNDRFSGYNSRTAETIGYGHMIKGGTVVLNLDAGLGAGQSTLATGERQSEGLLHAAANLDWQVSRTSTFSESVSSDMGKKSTVSKSVTALKSQIVGNLASKISYTAQYATKVPPGFTSLDTITAVTLVYSF